MKSYLITDPDLYTSDPKTFAAILSEALKRHNPTMACFRDKKSVDIAHLAAIFVQVARSYHLQRILIHSHITMAEALGADGVHLGSAGFEKISEAKQKGLFVVASTHTLEEALCAARLGADAITFSPIFRTPGKGEPKGLEKLKEIVAKIPVDVYALGGIVTPEQIRKVESTGVAGFASIRYFVG